MNVKIAKDSPSIVPGKSRYQINAIEQVQLMIDSRHNFIFAFLGAYTFYLEVVVVFSF